MKTPLQLFAIVVILLGACGTAGSQTGHDLAPAEFNKRLAEGVVLDVRTPEEFAEGHLSGAINIHINDPDFKQRIDSLDKSKTYLVYCRSGNRSSKAVSQMANAGFTHLLHLKGGILAWKKEGLQVITR